MRRRTIVLGGAASAMLAAAPVRAQQPGRTYHFDATLETPCVSRNASPSDFASAGCWNDWSRRPRRHVCARAVLAAAACLVLSRATRVIE
jgi:hypothetical protein